MFFAVSSLHRPAVVQKQNTSPNRFRLYLFYACCRSAAYRVNFKRLQGNIKKLQIFERDIRALKHTILPLNSLMLKILSHRFVFLKEIF